MKPDRRPGRSASMKEHEIDDRDLTPSSPVDPASLQHPDATLCPECQGVGATASGDSPQFSALTASNAPRAMVGSVLTLVNSIGFAISIVSIQLFVWLAQHFPLGTLSQSLAAYEPASRRSTGPCSGPSSKWP